MGSSQRGVGRNTCEPEGTVAARHGAEMGTGIAKRIREKLEAQVLEKQPEGPTLDGLTSMPR